MTNSNTMKSLKYGGIVAASILGAYLFYKTINTVSDPKIQSAAITAYEHPAALSDILQGKRYNTSREVQEGGSRKNKNKNKHIKRRSTKNKR